MSQLIKMILLAVLVATAVSCSEEEQYRKETYEVTGQVLVDGEPVKNLAVKAHNVEGMDQEHPTVTSAFTNEDGRFSLSTYEKGDGIPEGEYVLTFMWGKMNRISMSYGGPDKLKGRYSDPKKSEFQVTVGGDEPVDLGKIELSTGE